MKLLRLEEVIDLTGLSRSTIYRYEENRSFPKRRKTGPNSVRWLDSEVIEWIESRPVAADRANITEDIRETPGKRRH